MPDLAQLIYGFAIFSFGCLLGVLTWLMTRAFQALDRVEKTSVQVQEQIKTLFANDMRHEREIDSLEEKWGRRRTR